MKIKISKLAHYYTADCLDLPGSPKLGFGKTKREAVAKLFLIIFKNNYAFTIDMDIVEFIE